MALTPHLRPGRRDLFLSPAFFPSRNDVHMFCLAGASFLLFIATLPAFVYQSDLFLRSVYFFSAWQRGLPLAPRFCPTIRNPSKASKPIAYPAATPKALSTINSESYRSAVVAVTGVCVWAPMWANVIRALLPAVRIYFIPHNAKAFADAAKFF